jgi:hypothetical protein
MTSSGILYELIRNNVLIDLFDDEIINTTLRFSMNYSTRILTMKDLHRSDNGLYSMGDVVGLGFKTDYFYLSIEGEYYVTIYKYIYIYKFISSSSYW